MDQNTFTWGGDDVVALLTLSRPHCMDIEGKHAVLTAVNSLGENKTCRALIIAANHPAAWLVNVAELVEMTPEEARASSRAGHHDPDRLAHLDVPVHASA